MREYIECQECQGEGEIHGVDLDGINSDQQDTLRRCTKCNGFGLIKTTNEEHDERYK
jgi:DnaJ-class molecular chaperone